MRARRSRFVRVYHRLTRRAPNRRAQWGQIGELRPHGSAGHPAATLTLHAPQLGSVRRPIRDCQEIQLEDGDELELIAEHPAAPEAASGIAAIATLTALLFLLACAYAAFSGYTHTYDNALAYLAILGSVGCLMSAGTGICLAALGLGRRAVTRFLAVCGGSLTLLYALTLFFAVTAR